MTLTIYGTTVRCTSINSNKLNKIALVPSGHTDDIYNARLIVAAPDLLEALEKIVKENEDFRETGWSDYSSRIAAGYNDMAKIAKAAITKAKGES